VKILVTGGCGFIGSHLTDRLVKDGHKVRVYDLLEPQVHQGRKPSYLNPQAEYIYADVRNKDRLSKAIKDVEIIFHQASQVGVGQSMYQIEKYTAHNALGTAVLLDLLVNTKNKVKKLVVASSMSIYGEGVYKCKKCGIVYPTLRPDAQLKKKDWQMHCPKCSKIVLPVPTSEEKPLAPNSIYATNKRCQEEMCLEIGGAYKIPTVALRYFNVYGERQSLNNPYTGVCAIFLSQVKNTHAPIIFEDGEQTRDFIYISDIVEANILAMSRHDADYDFFNVGAQDPHTIKEIAEVIIALYNKKLTPKICNKFRAGDIRHCFADIGKIRRRLGFKPRVNFKEGMKKLKAWSENEKACDLTKKAQKELKERGLAE